MFRFFFVLILFGTSKSAFDLLCSNGRLAIWTFNIYTMNITANCPVVGQICGNSKGKCSNEKLCCPRTIKMSTRSRFRDETTRTRFTRIGNDYNGTYRLYEITLLPNKPSFVDNQERWEFFDHTLRDLFEMPHANFFRPLKNCLQNHGITYVFVPLNATSIFGNISAMVVLTRKNTTDDNLYLCYIATRKEHRRRGLATRLLQQTVTRALNEQSKGIKHIILNANTLNEAVIRLYEICGWRCFEYLPGYLEPDPYHRTNNAYTFKLDLKNVKNANGLCQNANAVDILQLDNERSLNICNRLPVRL